MNKVYEKYDNEWEMVKYERFNLTARLLTIGGWLVRNYILDEKKDCFIPTSLIFVYDPNHEWDIP
jgi:hypothetical protein